VQHSNPPARRNAIDRVHEDASVSTATSVRVREGRRVVTDGLFAERRKQLGGYYLIEASDLDAAIDVAERIPPARFGTIEIRPVLEITGLPTKVCALARP
jgi:hypothetical protein